MNRTAIPGGSAAPLIGDALATRFSHPQHEGPNRAARRAAEKAACRAPDVRPIRRAAVLHARRLAGQAPGVAA